MFLALLGRVDEAKPFLDAAIKAHEDLGQRMAALSLRGFALGSAEVTRENWTGAVREVRAACDAFQALGEKAAFSTLAGMLSLAMYETGELDDAYRYTELSVEAASPDDLASQYMWRAGRALVLAAWGRGDEALEYANEAVRVAEGTQGLMWWCDTYMARGEVYRLLGMREEAAADFRRSAELYEKKEAPLHAARARRKLGEVTG
jgi:tetratricopeptide (TPR) repeat protein